MIKEIWKPIKGYEGLYEISSLGRVKSLERYVANNGGKYLIKERILKPTKNQYGYLYVVISKNNINKHKLIHRLVAETFISNKHSKRTINHINGIKTDNTLENLEWCTHKENIQKAWENGLYKISEKQRINGRTRGKNNSKPVVQLDLENNVIKVWDSITKARDTLKISATAISNCARNKKSYNTAGGYKWRYKDK